MDFAALVHGITSSVRLSLVKADYPAQSGGNIVNKLDKLEINSQTLDNLQTIIQRDNIPRYRAQQIFRWVHRFAVDQFMQMRNLPRNLIEYLESRFYLTPMQLLVKRVSIDTTEKFLFGLSDGSTIESVLIPEKDRNTICISTQVGCAAGCSFCATGKQGFTRNLTAGEICKQAEVIYQKCPQITNIVFMGMGEPLHNYEQVLKSIQILNSPDGLALGMRRFTISTCGIVPKIRQLALDNDQVGLAVSLHAATDTKRQLIMPIAKKYPLAELIAACRFYTEQTGRRVTFEYALIASFNDSAEDLQQLVQLLQGLNCHVNLIPINPVVDTYKRPDHQVIEEFVKQLNQHHIPASIRRERGTDIEAACGQLKQVSREDVDENSGSH